MRLRSLDIFRGITIMAMIFVNLPGSWSHVYKIFEHSSWHGLMPADFIFPFFLFIMGVALAFSSKNTSQDFKTSWNILKRASLLIIVGWFIHSFPFYNWGEYWAEIKPLQGTWHETRFLGVLQRIGLCYALVALGLVWLGINSLRILALSILLIYSTLLYFWNPMEPYGISSNLVGFLDAHLFGTAHLWDKENSFDPEGLLSSLPACVNVIIGLEVGLLLRNKQLHPSMILTKMGLLTLFLFTGGLISWIWIPINKALWSASFTLITSAAATLCFGLFYWVIDLKSRNCKVLKVTEIFGSNALFAYILAEMWAMILWMGFMLPHPKDETWISAYQGLYEWIFKPCFGEWGGSVAFTVAHLILFGMAMNFLYKKKIWIKL